MQIFVKDKSSLEIREIKNYQLFGNVVFSVIFARHQTLFRVSLKIS